MSYHTNRKLGRLSVLADEKDNDITLDHIVNKKREGTFLQYLMLVMALLPHYYHVIWLQSNAVNLTSFVGHKTYDIYLAIQALNTILAIVIPVCD